VVWTWLGGAIWVVGGVKVAKTLINWHFLSPFRANEAVVRGGTWSDSGSDARFWYISRWYGMVRGLDMARWRHLGGRWRQSCENVAKLTFFDHMARMNRWYAVVHGPIAVLMPDSGRSLDGTEWYVVYECLRGATWFWHRYKWLVFRHVGLSIFTFLQLQLRDWVNTGKKKWAFKAELLKFLAHKHFKKFKFKGQPRPAICLTAVTSNNLK